MDLREVWKPALAGAVAGSVAITVVGFSVLGWKSNSTADKMAADRAEAAIVDVLTPICVEQFKQQGDYAAKLAELKGAPSWTRYSLIEKAGLATMPGTDETHPAVARACAAKLGELS